ncbi:MAG: hypothetical protein Q4B48_02770 [Syntrophomonadaceae bacterium]|nr:hypothetical protein [Syntrophomonadaceae bacterium]
MATNSILNNVWIKDKKSAEKLITAFEQAQNAAPKEVVYQKKVSVATRDEVKALFGKQ